ncbi:hypothetical protein NEOLEDRAFT_1182488 [Neolentinus lepideus HHB14362 ss-1]|uniref:Uncharacterized protein n=1 Tax=Neolentinus lepideus HHB14362 ss-1 TaxID=1314782 RepID=A0A165P502_9AGAM|nr:hypothetical protein NEOLEDRAFT_1182488 [Neolentinus lepideus HHB14362 ss-1]
MSGIGDKVNGVVEMVEGIGDQIRGSLMETLDTSLSSISNSNSGDQAPAQGGMSKNAELWARGKEEYRQGRAKMSGRPAGDVGAVQENSVRASDAQNVSAATEGGETDRPPIPPRELRAWG